MYHEYGSNGLCLLWAVNNALQGDVLTPSVVLPYIEEENKKNKKRNIRSYASSDGIDFRVFKKVLKEVFQIRLVKVDKVNKGGKYIITYDFGDYYHTVGYYKGKVLDSRRRQEITTLNPGHRVVDIYRVVVNR
jgi:hypothetical protein